MGRRKPAHAPPGEGSVVQRAQESRVRGGVRRQVLHKDPVAALPLKGAIGGIGLPVFIKHFVIDGQVLHDDLIRHRNFAQRFGNGLGVLYGAGCLNGILQRIGLVIGVW